MKLVIDISQNDYEEIKEYGINTFSSVAIAIQNGTPLEEELEKIKAEIRKLTDINPDYPMDRTIHISRNEVLEIIDKHIAELKGENNE